METLEDQEYIQLSCKQCNTSQNVCKNKGASFSVYADNIQDFLDMHSTCDLDGIVLSLLSNDGVRRTFKARAV